METREYDGCEVRLRRCFHHVYEDVTYFYKGGQFGSSNGRTFQLDDNRHSNPPRANETQFSTRPCLLDNQHLRPTPPLPKRRSSCPAPLGETNFRNPVQVKQKSETPPGSPGLVDDNQLPNPPLLGETISCSTLRVEETIDIDSASIYECSLCSAAQNEHYLNPPHIDEDMKKSSPTSTDEGRSGSAPQDEENPRQVEETINSNSASIYECRLCRAEQDEQSNPLQIDEHVNSSPTSIDEDRSYSDPQNEERTYSNPPRTYEDVNSRLTSIDECRLCRAEQHGGSKYSNPPQIDDNVNSSPTSIDECRLCRAEQDAGSQYSNPPQIDENVNSQPTLTEECRLCRTEQDAGSQNSNPPQIDVDVNSRLTPFDGCRLCRAEQDGESKYSNPQRIDEDVNSSPTSIDGGRSCNNVAEVEAIISSNPQEVDETTTPRPPTLEGTRVTRPSDPPQFDEKTFSRTLQSDEINITISASVDVIGSSYPPQPSSAPPPVSEQEQERRGRGHFVKGYVVRNRKPKRHVPALNTNSWRDDDDSDARAIFHTLGEVEEVGHVPNMFWPQPGDIIVLQSHRSEIPYPGFDGHVELYIDECYFHNTEYFWDWTYDFREGDILVRIGRFSSHWKWSPRDSVQVYLRCGDCFVLVAREVNHELWPLDFRFSDPKLRPIHSIQVDFQPRVGDLIVRKDSARPFNWTLLWWKEGFYVSQPFDMLVRASFANSDDHIHSFGMAEVYFRNAQNQHWRFQGRDDYTFGRGP